MSKQNLSSFSTNCLLNTDIEINHENKTIRLWSISPSRRKYLISAGLYEVLSVITITDMNNIPTFTFDNFRKGIYDENEEESYIIHDDAVILDVGWMDNEKLIILYVEIISHDERGFYILNTEGKKDNYFAYGTEKDRIPFNIANAFTTETDGGDSKFVDLEWD